MIREQRESHVTDAAGAKGSVEEMFNYLFTWYKGRNQNPRARVSKLYIAVQIYPAYFYSFTGTQPCPLINILSMAAFVLQAVVARETCGLQSLKYLLSGSLQNKFAGSCTKCGLN